MKALGIGSDGRIERKDKNKKKIEQDTREIIERNLTCLSKQDIDIDEYQLQLKDVLYAIELNYKIASNFRISRAYLSQYIDQGNADKAWTLPVPPYPIRITTDKTIRTTGWFQLMSVIAEGYSVTNAFYSQSEVGITDDNALSMCLLSAAINGGLCEPHSLVAFANILLNDAKPLQIKEQACWIDIIIKESMMPSNAKDDEGHPYTLRRWFPDTNTLLWIFRVKSLKANFTASSIDASDVLTRIRKLFKSASFFRPIPTNSLRKFLQSCIGITETLPGVRLPNALAMYAIGSVHSVSLPDRSYRYLCFNQMTSNQNTTIDININDFDQIEYSRLSPVRSKRRLKIVNARLVRDIKRALCGVANSPSKRSKTEALRSLILIREYDDRPYMINIFIEWLIWLLKERNLKPSSVYRYYSSIGKAWFEGAWSFDPDEKIEEDFINLYEGIIYTLKSEGSKHYAMDRLIQFHEFGVLKADFPYIQFDRGNNGAKYPFVNAGYIPEGLYNQVLSTLGSMKGASPQLIRALQGIAILAMRTGMRKGEILKLRLCDIELSDEMYLFVRNNIYGDNKSTSALRKIPLGCLLLDVEIGFLKKYILQRRSYKANEQVLLFSKDINPYLPLNGHQVTRLFNFILRSLSGIDYTFHHFRHTALSNFQVILTGQVNLLTRYQNFNIELARKIWRGLSPSEFSDNQRDLYWIISGLAGHASPETTLGTYLHFTDELLHHSLINQEVSQSESFLVTHIGLPKNVISTHRKNNKSSAACIPVDQLKDYLYKKLTKFSRKIKTESNITESISTEDKASSPLKSSGSVALCLNILEQYEQGRSIFEICHDLHEKGFIENKDYATQLINKYINSAMYLSNLKTSKGVSRLFSSNIKSNPRGRRLLPIKPRSHGDDIDADKLIQKLRDIYPNNKSEINWAINYFILNTDTSSSKIKFDNKNDLDRFLNIMLRVTSDKRWFLKLDLISGNKRIWKSGLPKKLNLAVNSSNIARKNKASLHLLHINNDDYLTQNEKYDKYSSNSLRYVFHVLAIIIGCNQ